MNVYKIKLAAFALCLMLFGSKAFAQDTESPDTSWFTDVTDKVGLNHMVNPGGLLIVDVNNDDYPDLITFSGLGSDTGVHLYLNEEAPGSTDPTNRVFVDVTATSGLNVPGVYHDLAGAADFDNDGNIDLVTNCWPLDNQTNCVTTNPAKEKMRIWWGDGQGHFTLDSIASSTPTGLEALGSLSGSGLPALDYDRDGNLDFFVACHFDSWCYENATAAHLMHNNGNRTFSDSATAAGINISEEDSSKPWLTPPSARALFGANMSDWNNDCWPDIFTCPYEANGYPFTATHCLYNYGSFEAYAPCNLDTQDTRGYGNLYENLGGQGKLGKFKDVGVTANYDTHFAWAMQGIVPWAAMPADYNNDGNMDYLVLEVHGANEDSTSGFNFPAEPGNGRTVILTNSGPSHGYKLNYDVGRIRRSFPINETHGDHTGCWIDMNNDGYEDLLIGDAVYAGSIDNQRIFFELQDTAKHIFNDITEALGYCAPPTTIDYKIRRPGNLSPIDYDLDGDDDIIKIPYTWPQDSILMLRNNVGNRNNHITVKLIAPDGVNKSCIGARIRVVAGNLRMMKDIMGDMGQWTNEYPFIQNFGLGQRTMIDTIDVRWPDANCTHTIVTHVAANQFVRIDSAGISGIMPIGHTTPNNFSIYPNPDNGDNINIRFQGPVNPFIAIYNELGQQVADYKPGYASSFTLPLGNIPAGLYFIHVIGVPSTSVTTQSFIKTTH